MKSAVLPALVCCAALTAGRLLGHDLEDPDNPHPHYDSNARPPAFFLAQANVQEHRSVQAQRPAQAAAFDAFKPAVTTRWDNQFLYIEGNGIPAHPMMVGITAWQQQVPLPQAYTGANAWRLPLSPVPAREPLPVKNRFLRGAIAIAANGIPIFNPQNNRGALSAEIGELDQWGGHCGRADDYHYHAAPLHLQAVLGKSLPVAYALDGYPIYGLAEPDGATPAGLDAFNGHTTALGYHYHASTKYPYVNGGFHGEVTEREGQVDPQPRARPVRPDLPPLPGARITAFNLSPDGKQRSLLYTVGGKQGAVNFSESDPGAWRFQFISADGSKREEAYSSENRRGGPPQRPRREAAPPSPAAAAKSSFGMDTLKKPLAGFALRSPAIGSDGRLPVEFTGDGAGVTPPLEWRDAPAGTRSYALVMDHLAPDDEIKTYWTLWDIPASTAGLPKDVRGVGKVGASFRGGIGYEPPRSKGPGAKTYILTLYALAAPPQLTQPPNEVTREVLLAAIGDKVLASASLPVTYDRTGRSEGGPTQREKSPPAERPAGGNLIKAAMTDTIKAEVYADNWFALYINGRLAVVDPIAFLPHNVVSVDLLPEYPMTLAVIAHDNADPKTGLEYGNRVGEAGFILRFSDGSFTDASWKVKVIERGPIGGDIEHPRVETVPRPENWFAPEFDDSAWENATVFTEQRVNPKQPYYEHDFQGAQFIWSRNLDLDNTVLFRKRIEKPGWTPRWNAQAAGFTPQP